MFRALKKIMLNMENFVQRMVILYHLSGGKKKMIVAEMIFVLL